jgi:nicotinamidase-related amidase
LRPEKDNMVTALLIIDLQEGMAIRTREGRERVNPGAEARVTDLRAVFAARGLPVVHVFHDEADPASSFYPGAPGHAPLPCAVPAPGEAVFHKTGSSAFMGTGLDAYLRRQGIDQLVLVGAVAAFCVTSTCRQASDLGFRVILPGDALIGFDLPAHDGGRIDAATVLRVTLSLLGADFARLVTSDQVASLV